MALGKTNSFFQLFLLQMNAFRKITIEVYFQIILRLPSFQNSLSVRARAIISFFIKASFAKQQIKLYFRKNFLTVLQYIKQSIYATLLILIQRRIISMKSFPPQSKVVAKTRIRTLSQSNQKQKQALKQKILSTESIKQNQNKSLSKQKKPTVSYILSLLLQNNVKKSSQKFIPTIKTPVKQKPRLTIKCKQKNQQKSSSQLKITMKQNKNDIQKRKLYLNYENMDQTKSKKPFKQQEKIAKIAQKEEGTYIFERGSQQRQTSENLIIKKPKSTEEINKSNLQFNLQFSFYTQFSICICSSNPLQNKSVGTQTTYDQYQDIFFYQQFCKYRYMKSKMYKQVKQKKEAIDRLIQKSIEFKTNYQDLINSTSRDPENDREKRVFQLSKQLEAAEKQMNQAYKKINDGNVSFEEDLNRKMPLVYEKKETLRVSIVNQLKILLQAYNFPQTELQKQPQSISKQPSSKQLPTEKSMIQKIIHQLKSLKQIDKSQRKYVSQMFMLCHQRIIEFQKVYKTWSNLYYENRVLLYNFMKHIQKIPALMTQLFGCRRAQNEGEQFFKKERQDLLKEYLSSKCEECYDYKTKIAHLQQINHEIKPIFKALQWLLRDGSKKKSCIELI